MGFEDFVELSFLIPLLPLVGAVVAGFFGARYLKGRSHWPIWLGVGASAFLSIGLLVATVDHTHVHPGQAIGQNQHWFEWIRAGNFSAAAAAWIDPLSVVMLSIVCGIGLLITIFAAGYMKGEEGYFRFFAYLGLFIFAMTCLVMGNNFILLYLGWEGVGLCSFLLIGYYYDKPAARDAAKKAFLVNRVGDFGFAVGVMLVYLAFGSVTFFADGRGVLELAALPLDRLAAVPGVNVYWAKVAFDWVPFCLMLGAFGKSAQFPLYVWLPDAMEGPTPVSALIHAATMVTAGVYMIARCGTLFAGNPAAMITIAFVGAFTAFLAATIALRQFDLKKVFAYSTISQLGFMFAAVGVLAPVPGVFHLMTHAFFKALLFLGSGVVMHAMLGELDLRKMSGLKRVLPKTRWLLLIGCLALSGFPFFSGFFSKDAIVAAAWEKSRVLGVMLLVTAFLTAYYTFRLYFRVFEGPEHIPPAPGGGGHGHDDVDEHLAGGGGHHNHEPNVMIVPLILLAVGAVAAGWFGRPLATFLGHSPSLIKTEEVALRAEHAGRAGEVNPLTLGQAEYRDREAVEHEESLHLLFGVVSGIVALCGIGLAMKYHLRNRAAGDALPRRVPALSAAIENKYWVDEFYMAFVVAPLRAAGRFFYAFDRLVIDTLVWLVGFVPQFGGFALKLTTQRGYLQGYGAAMMFGIVVILVVVFW